MNFKGKKMAVLGLGLSGQAAVRFLMGEGANVAVVDDKFGKLSPGALATVFRNQDMVVVSPGVPLNHPGLLLARRHHIPIIGEFGLACELLKVPMIAVTGTNGKSTTVTMIAKILEKAGKRVALAGNIGKPLLEVVMEAKKLDWVVAEVSSYQLETVRRFRPKIAVLLNITEDHLDRYASFKDYARAKYRIFKEQGAKDFLIYNEADPVVKLGVRMARAQKIGFSSPLKFDQTKLIGIHNAENMTAAFLAARAAGVDEKTIKKVFSDFEGLPHRTQFVREHEGVRYYDDSKGTNVDAVVKSLEGFEDGRVLLIAGGKDKGGSYRPLRKMAQRKVKLAITLGEASGKIAKSLKGATKVIPVKRLEEAVPLAAQEATTGDVVLLSPACSSFDQFKDYKERGDLFQRLVKEL